MPRMNKTQFQEFQTLLEKVQRYSPFYQEKFREEGFDIRSVQTPDDIVQVPFTQKEDLRNAYPLGLIATAEENIVRIHSSSGTTGQPVIIPYTAGDVVIWAEMMKRCMEYAGVTKRAKIIRKTGNTLVTHRDSFVISGINDLCLVFCSGLSNTRISDGSTVTHPITPSKTPFAITSPRSRPSVKVIKQSAANPAMVVTELPTTEVRVSWMATAIASL